VNLGTKRLDFVTHSRGNWQGERRDWNDLPGDSSGLHDNSFVFTANPGNTTRQTPEVQRGSFKCNTLSQTLLMRLSHAEQPFGADEGLIEAKSDFAFMRSQIQNT
jgi:hypothetical protein